MSTIVTLPTNYKGVNFLSNSVHVQTYSLKNENYKYFLLTMFDVFFINFYFLYHSITNNQNMTT